MESVGDNPDLLVFFIDTPDDLEEGRKDSFPNDMSIHINARFDRISDNGLVVLIFC